MRDLHIVLKEILPVLKEHKDSLIIGVETAASLNALSPTWGVPVTLLLEALDLGV